MRSGVVLRCREERNGCGAFIPVWTTKEKGQFKCPECGHRPRADLRYGGSGAVVEVLGECRRWEVREAAHRHRMEEEGV